ncbi:hypothetical protein BDZ91DRAFT_714555 [Kalaharituber pfeilii]|nr:hypothetical protein BDZ91DRAFT_714555 [Kalaharituber pfeilii]
MPGRKVRNVHMASADAPAQFVFVRNLPTHRAHQDPGTASAFGGWLPFFSQIATTLENTTPISPVHCPHEYSLLTPSSTLHWQIHWHASLTVHCLHRGKSRHVLIHEDGKMETLPVGMDVEDGDRMQWVVPEGI